MTRRIAVFISGGGSNMKALVAGLQDDPAGDVALVLSNDPTSGGIAWAKSEGIATAVVDHTEFETRSAFEAGLQQHLSEHDIDLICLAGFMRILTAEFTTDWAGAMVNIHPSLLPKYKGLNTHQRALDAGDTAHGCSVHMVTGDLDDGPILGQATIQVDQDDTAQTLAARVLKAEHILFPSVLKRFLAGDATPLTLSF